MTKHSNREKEIMLYLQKNYPEIRIWRWDNGQAYAKHTVRAALEEYKKTRSITQAIRKLQVITYGNEGYPDLGGFYYGIAVGIEIKVGKDRQSKEQKTMERVFKEGGAIYILLNDKSPIQDQLKPLDGIREWARKQMK